MNQLERSGDEEDAIRLAIEQRMTEVWTSFPGIIQSWNPSNMTVTIQPAIRARITLVGPKLDANGKATKDENFKWQQLPILIYCPVVFQAAGGFAITFPIQQGDECLVVIASRCIDGWWQLGGIQNQVDLRLHDLSDGFALIGPKSVPNVIPNISSATLQIRTKAGDCYIEVTTDGKIKLHAASGVTIDGDLLVNGKITVTGDVLSGTPPISLEQHKHLLTGGGLTGLPQP